MKAARPWLAGVGLGTAFLLAPRWVRAQRPDLDEERSAWRFERSVLLPPPEGAPSPALAALAVSPEVGARCQPQLEDVRLVTADGREVPYVVGRAVEREGERVYRGRLVDTRSERRQRTVWVVDLGEPRDFDLISLEIPGQDFVKRIGVEASADAQTWKTLRTDAGVFDRPWNVRVHHTWVELPERTRARYLRLSADDHRSLPIEVLGVSVSAHRRWPGESWERSVVLTPLGAGAGGSRYRLELPPSFPLERLELVCDDAAFSRRVALREVTGSPAGGEETILGEANLYRLQIEDEALSGESRAMPVRRGRGGELVLEVQDGDSPPLRNLRALASAPAIRLLFPPPSGPLTLYYANESTRAPAYDLEALKERIALAPQYAPTALGAETENPRYRKPAPLPFAAPRGAPLEVARWRAERPFNVSGREDLYTLTLAGEDMSLLRDDLGDLRIVDGEGRQVPYVLDAGALKARVPLSVTQEPSPSTSERRAITRWRLAPGASSGAPLPLPMAGVELTFREVFFTRPARLLSPAEGGRRPVLFSGTLAAPAPERSPRRGTDDAGPEGTLAAEPIALALDGTRRGVLFLEVNEGDNLPLTLLQARSVVPVPRLAFKVSAGAFRILLGNRAATAPRYDIATLRREILSYSALPLQPGARAPNPAFRRGAADYFQEAPPTLILWGTLLGAVAALLFLTVRIVRRPPDPSAP